MKKTLRNFLYLLIQGCIIPSSILCTRLEDEIFSHKKFFTKSMLPDETYTLVTAPDRLGKAAQNYLHQLKKKPCYYHAVMRKNHPALSSQADLDNLFTHRARATLAFIINIIKEDQRTGHSYRMSDPNFIKEHFDILAWKPEKKKGTRSNPNTIRITKYAVFRIPGRASRQGEFTCALYQFNHKKDANRYAHRFTKQEIVAGALEKEPYKKKVRRLVWLTREGLEEALMQGTIHVRLPSGKEQIFTVDVNNGYAYDRNNILRRTQKRYWYFTPVKKNAPQSVVLNNPELIVAGDMYQIGLGKLIALIYTNNITKKEEMRLCLLADTGGAFTNNLHQLDLFAGTFQNRKQLFATTRHLPHDARAYILVVKD